jgi:hypothetical protein
VSAAADSRSFRVSTRNAPSGRPGSNRPVRVAPAAGNWPCSPFCASRAPSNRDRRSRAPSARSRDMVEDHQRSERATALLRLEKRVRHRYPVIEHIGERDGEEVAPPTGAIFGAASPVLDHAGANIAVLDHHGVVEERHVGHATVRVTRIEIGAEHAILFRSWGCDAHFAGHIGVALATATRVHRRRGRSYRSMTHNFVQTNVITRWREWGTEEQLPACSVANLRRVIADKGAPTLTGRVARPGHVFGYGCCETANPSLSRSP